MKHINSKSMTLILVAAAVVNSAPNWITNPTHLIQVAAHSQGSANLSMLSDVRGGADHSVTRSGVEFETNQSDFVFKAEGSDIEYQITEGSSLNNSGYKSEYCPEPGYVTDYEITKIDGNKSKVTLTPKTVFEENKEIGRFFTPVVDGISRSMQKQLRTEFKIVRNARVCTKAVNNTKQDLFYFEVKTDHANGSECNRHETTMGSARSEKEMRDKIEEATEALNDCMLDVSQKIAEQKLKEKYAKDIEQCKVGMIEPGNILAGIKRFDQGQSLLTSSMYAMYSPVSYGLQAAAYAGGNLFSNGMSVNGNSYQSSLPNLTYSTRTGSYASVQRGSMYGSSFYSGYGSQYGSMRGETNYDNSLVAQAECFVEQYDSPHRTSRTTKAFTAFLNKIDALLNHPSKQDSVEAQHALMIINESELTGKLGARAAALTEYAIARDRMADLFTRYCKVENNVYLCPMELKNEVAGVCQPNMYIGQMECDGGLLGFTQQVFNYASREEGIRGHSGEFGKYMSRLYQEASVMINNPSGYANVINPKGGPIIFASEMEGTNNAMRFENLGSANANSGSRNARSGAAATTTGNTTTTQSGLMKIASPQSQQQGPATSIPTRSKL